MHSSAERTWSSWTLDPSCTQIVASTHCCSIFGGAKLEEHAVSVFIMLDSWRRYPFGSRPVRFGSQSSLGTSICKMLGSANLAMVAEKSFVNAEVELFPRTSDGDAPNWSSRWICQSIWLDSLLCNRRSCQKYYLCEIRDSWIMSLLTKLNLQLMQVDG